MATIDVPKLVAAMLPAARKALSKKWPAARDYAELEFKKIGESILFIEKQRALGRMTDSQAKLHLEIQKNAARTVLLGIEGLGLLAAEAAINAALQVIKDTVNAALGFALI